MILKLKKKIIYCHKSPTFEIDVDIEKVLVSKKIPSGDKNYKHFISYLYDNNKVKPLHPKTNAYVKNYDGKTKWMYFLIEDDDFTKIQ